MFPLEQPLFAFPTFGPISILQRVKVQTPRHLSLLAVGLGKVAENSSHKHLKSAWKALRAEVESCCLML